MPMVKMTPQLVLPSDIPWRSLKGVDLEECLYWLLADMDAKELDWRKGGLGGGAADQGRDIEAVFARPTPDGEVEIQRWWVEAKGRSGTVEASVVHDAVNRVASRADIDVVIIATNTQFSNPTRDWVREWQKTHPRPFVRLWERETLEKLVIAHPSVVVRLFEDALSLQAKADVAGMRFWSHLHIPTKKERQQFWQSRNDLCLSDSTLLAVIVGDARDSDLEYHSWLALVQDKQLQRLLELVVGKTSYLLAKSEDVNQCAIESASAYVLMVALLRFNVVDILPLFENVTQCNTPVQLVRRTRYELEEQCRSDCRRFETSGCYKSRFRIGIPKSFWARFGPATDEERPKAKHVVTSGMAILEKSTVPCQFGFHVDAEHNCPLRLQAEITPDKCPDVLTICQAVLKKGLAAHEGKRRKRI
jgi:hypothetical protein